jgi:hypothetical protein
MKPDRLIIFIPLVLLSCTSTRTNNSGIKQAEDNSYYYYEQDSPFINLSLLGDYKFQPLKTKYFRDIDSRFIKYLTTKLNNKKPAILFSAHTYIQPFYSAICVQYKGCNLDTTLINSIKAGLKANLKTSFTKIEKLKCGSKDAYKIVYQATNSLTSIYSYNTEYFFSNNQIIYRLFLWTTNSDQSVIAIDGENIIKEARFE